MNTKCIPHQIDGKMSEVQGKARKGNQVYIKASIPIMYVVALVKKFPIQDRGKQNQTKSKQFFNCGNIQK